MKTAAPMTMRTAPDCQGVTLLIQNGADFQNGTTGRPGDDFWQFNALAGPARFCRRFSAALMLHSRP